MAFLSSSSCKGVSLACNGRWLSNDDIFRMGHAFFCTIVDEDAKYRFIICLIAKVIWVVISQVWALIKEMFCHR